MPLANLLVFVPATPTPAPDPDYAFGQKCTWHGPLTFTARRAGDEPCCPNCGQPVYEMSTSSYWEVIYRNSPQYIAMTRWSQNRCFPDYDTQLAAYLAALGAA